MKKLILLFLFFSIFSGLIYSQPVNAVTNNPLIKGNEGLLGAQCVDGIVYDDNTWENGIGVSGSGIGKLVMLLTPSSYPYTINQVCLALTRVAAGSPNWTFDIIIYDNTGTGGSPGNQVAIFTNKTASNVPVWPMVSWFDFTGLTGIPVLTTGQSYYVGMSWNLSTQGSHYIGVDESATTPLRLCYSNNGLGWILLGGTHKALGIRADGFPVLQHNIAVGPFLSLPALFNKNVMKTIKAKIANFGSSNETGIPVKFFVQGVQVNTISLNLNAGAVDSVAFSWTPPDTGNYNLKIVSALANDEFRANDTVSTTVQVYPPGYYQVCWGTGATAVGYPFFTSYMDSRTAMLYLASDIGTGASTITKIGFSVVTASPQVMNGFMVLMRNTTANTISSYGIGMYEVYSGTYTVPGTGLQYITLTTPFVYTGGNLLVEICFNNSSYTSNSTVYSTAITGRCYHAHQNLPSDNGCTIIDMGTIQTTLPNVCFQGIITGINGKTNNGIPDNFSLEQNYPNPFNPKTIINYQLPISNYVKLTIFDALGREVAVLVNEKQSAGNYSVELDASNYSSGLYFYKLECEGFSDVKKMLIVK